MSKYYSDGNGSYFEESCTEIESGRSAKSPMQLVEMFKEDLKDKELRYISKKPSARRLGYVKK